MAESLLYPSPHMGQAQLEAYMWQKVPGAPERKFNPFRKTGPVPAERFNEHGLLGVGQKGYSGAMAAIPRPSGPAGSMADPMMSKGVRAGASPSKAKPMQINSGFLYPSHPSGGANRGSPISSTPHNPLPPGVSATAHPPGVSATAHPSTKKTKKSKSRKHAPPLPTKKESNPFPDIPMPSSTGKENPFLQAYEELAAEDKYQDFEAPAMKDSPICWNPRAKEMHNMQEWHTERLAFTKRVADPRKEYLSRYAHIREALCSNRFRNPEYSRVVPTSCTPTQNPWNYAAGPPSMFGSAPLGDQSASDGVAVQRSIGNLPVHKWETSDGVINTHSAYEATGSDGRYTDYTVAPTTYASQAYPTCPPNTSWDQTSGTCLNLGGSTASPMPY